VRALVIEDDATVASGLQRGLAGEGFAVEAVYDGRSGLARARADHFDLIILDLMLPSLNGYKVCQELRSEGDPTPILMLTAKSGIYDEAEGLETGADDFLTKPFSMVVLVARVRALLRRPARRADWPAVGDLRLDPLRHRCFRGDVAVELTAREMEVLAYLVDRPGQIVGKVELLTAVWEHDFAGDPNIVEVYVSRLRRKIDGPSGGRRIETVRGQGYRLVIETPV
jgi:DNA-binding response OmpR family regulator